MAAVSDFLEQRVMNHVFRDTTYSKPSVIAIALTTNLPSDGQTGATIPEVANSGSYARVNLCAPGTTCNAQFTHSTSGVLTNTNLISFTAASADWGMVSGVAICDSATHGAGNVLWHGALTVARDVRNGDTFTFGIGNLSLTLA